MTTRTNDRPSLDKYFLDIAATVATRSTCTRRQIGCVIVVDRQVVATGYNDTPKKWKNCGDGGCSRATSETPTGEDLANDNYVCCHAEENALIQAARHGISVRNGVIYSTLTPCVLCAKMIINSDIKKVVYREIYPTWPKSKELFDKAEVETIQS